MRGAIPLPLASPKKRLCKEMSEKIKDTTIPFRAQGEEPIPHNDNVYPELYDGPILGISLVGGRYNRYVSINVALRQGLRG